MTALIAGCAADDAGSAPPSADERVPGVQAARAAPSDLEQLVDPPPAYPGFIWTGPDGKRLSKDELALWAGPARCDWQDVAFLSGTVFGDRTKTGALTGRRAYVRALPGTLGQVGARYERDLDLRAERPAGARANGYTLLSDVELWLDPRDEDRYAYLISDGHSVERWARADELLCA